MKEDNHGSSHEANFLSCIPRILKRNLKIILTLNDEEIGVQREKLFFPGSLCLADWQAVLFFLNAVHAFWIFLE